MTEVATNYVREFQSVEVDATNKAGETKFGPGFWVPVNPSDTHVIEIAQFAVKAYNQQHPHTNLVKVIGGKMQIVCGTNYKLTIEAKHERPGPPSPLPQRYEAVVYEDLHGKKELISFVPLNSKEGVNN